uniref:Uncharacterized protein n=1 Tax=Glossina austeni TaxID=7395 RepID=A0A1A9UMP0_GLOAU
MFSVTESYCIKTCNAQNIKVFLLKTPQTHQKQELLKVNDYYHGLILIFKATPLKDKETQPNCVKDLMKQQILDIALMFYTSYRLNVHPGFERIDTDGSSNY